MAGDHIAGLLDWSQIGVVPTEHALYRTPRYCSVQCSGLRNDVARKFVAVSNVVSKRYCADLCLHASNPCLCRVGVMSLIGGPRTKDFFPMQSIFRSLLSV